jgi:transcriptional activator of cad operon
MAAAFSVGGWHVEPSSRTLTRPDGDVHLERRSCRSWCSWRSISEVVTKEALFQMVWPDTFVGDEVLSRTIFELRRALGDDSKAPRYIKAIPKDVSIDRHAA